MDVRKVEGMKRRDMWHAETLRESMTIQSKAKWVMGMDDVDIDVIQAVGKWPIRRIGEWVTRIPRADPARDTLHIRRVKISARHVRTDDDNFIPTRHQLIRKRANAGRNAIDDRVPALGEQCDSQRAALIESCAPSWIAASASPDVSRIPTDPCGAR